MEIRIQSAEPKTGTVGTANGLAQAAGDYELVTNVIRCISEYRDAQPGLEEIADRIGVSAGHCHKVFRRWCGVTPKTFLSALTLDHARGLLRQDASVLDAALQSGLSGPSRLHDLFLDFEPVTPGAYRAGCAGLSLVYGEHKTPFGNALVVATTSQPSRLAGLAFIDVDPSTGVARNVLSEFQARWPKATYTAQPELTAPFVERIFSRQPPPEASPSSPTAFAPLRIVMIGTDFEVRVWEKLAQVPQRHAVSYSQLATAVDRPGAQRAVGRAVGHNPLAFVIPCHRVIRSDGGLGGYHWGLTRKRALIGWETASLVR